MSCTTNNKWTPKEITYLSLLVSAIIAAFLLIKPSKNEIVVEKIVNGRMLAKDVKTGKEKIFILDRNNLDFDFVAQGDTLTYTTPWIRLNEYKKNNIIENYDGIKLNTDSLFARQQLELFNQEIQKMSEKQK